MANGKIKAPSMDDYIGLSTKTPVGKEVKATSADINALLPSVGKPSLGEATTEELEKRSGLVNDYMDVYSDRDKSKPIIIESQDVFNKPSKITEDNSDAKWSSQCEDYSISGYYVQDKFSHGILNEVVFEFKDSAEVRNVVNEFCDWAKQKGAKYIQAETDENTVGFWQDLGFELIEAGAGGLPTIMKINIDKIQPFNESLQSHTHTQRDSVLDITGIADTYLPERKDVARIFSIDVGKLDKKSAIAYLKKLEEAYAHQKQTAQNVIIRRGQEDIERKKAMALLNISEEDVKAEAETLFDQKDMLSYVSNDYGKFIYDKYGSKKAKQLDTLIDKQYQLVLGCNDEIILDWFYDNFENMTPDETLSTKENFKKVIDFFYKFDYFLENQDVKVDTSVPEDIVELANIVSEITDII